MDWNARNSISGKIGQSRLSAKLCKRGQLGPKFAICLCQLLYQEYIIIRKNTVKKPCVWWDTETQNPAQGRAKKFSLWPLSSFFWKCRMLSVHMDIIWIFVYTFGSSNWTQRWIFWQSGRPETRGPPIFVAFSKNVKLEIMVDKARFGKEKRSGKYASWPPQKLTFTHRYSRFLRKII